MTRIAAVYQTGVGTFHWPLVHGIRYNCVTVGIYSPIPNTFDLVFINADPKLWIMVSAVELMDYRFLWVTTCVVTVMQGIPSFNSKNTLFAHASSWCSELCKIRKFISQKDTKRVVHGFISKLNYCNDLFYVLPSSEIKKLQRLQNSAAPILTRGKISEHRYYSSPYQSALAPYRTLC